MQAFRSASKLNASDLFRGNRGGIIPMHRALTRLRFGAAEMLSSLGLAAISASAWIVSLPWVCSFWKRIFVIGARVLPMDWQVKTSLHRFDFGMSVVLPYFAIDPIMPSAHLWTATCIVVLATFAGTFVVRSSLIPVVYLVRCVLFVQASALVYFVVFPAQFPYAPADYLEGLLLSGAALTGVVPLLLLLAYYIFPFSFLKKVSLTFVTVGYLAIFLPLQVMLHAVILGQSILFMPVLYLVLGTPLDVFIIVALYAWGMTWEFKESPIDARLGR